MDDRERSSSSGPLPAKMARVDAVNSVSSAPPVIDLSSEDERLPVPLKAWTTYHSRLLEMFPDMDPDYLRNRCGRLVENESNFYILMDELLSTDYPKRRTNNELPVDAPGCSNGNNRENQGHLEKLIDIFPDADPSYLEEMSADIKSTIALQELIEELWSSRDYPTRADYNKRLEQEREFKMFKENFSIDTFLKLFPDPVAYFANADRKSDYDLSMSYLKNTYRKKRINDLSIAFKRFNENLTLTVDYIEKNSHTIKDMRSQRASCGMPNNNSIPFTQEVAFLEHRKQIEEAILFKKRQRQIAFETAKSRGELLTCNICYEDEILVTDMVQCSEGHLLCNICVKTAMTNDISENKTSLKCYAGNCDAEYTLSVAQELLDARMFSRFALKRCADDVRAAELEDLETCPFCEYACIIPPEDKVFRCLNPDCLQESCRKCREVSHIPLRCEEVERKSEVKVRTFIEDEMTNALIRVCYKCNQKFIKEEGCNKMTCKCGAKMCYICQKPVSDYSHFNGMGGTETHKCPLFSDMNVLHRDAVENAAKKAKEEALKENPDIVIKHDPTKLLPEVNAASAARAARLNMMFHPLLNMMQPVPRLMIPPALPVLIPGFFQDLPMRGNFYQGEERNAVMRRNAEELRRHAEELRRQMQEDANRRMPGNP